MALVRLVAALVVTAALVGAAALNDPVGQGARDVVPAQPEAVAGVGAGADAGLPPLALILDAPLPDGIGDLPVREQLEPLRTLAAGDAPARRLVELGSVYQSLGLGSEARQAYLEAAERDPGDLAARVGLILVPAATGAGPAMETADTRLAALERAEPEAQIVAFNRAWLAIYRADAATARAGLERTVALDGDTRLGAAARGLLDALGTRPAASAP